MHRETRASNKTAHPGLPNMPAPRWTHAEVEEARQEAAAKEAETAARLDKAIDNVAAVEDKQCRKDQARDRECKKALELSSK